VGHAILSAAATLDTASESDATDMLARCCGSVRWARAMAARRPFESDAALFAAADEEWAKAGRDDILEALAHHPRIGANVDELRQKYASTASWAANEQAGAAAASEETLLALRDANERYHARFGYVFVVCATGKSAGEMLAILRSRIDNAPDTELRIAAEQQHLITRIRLEKLA
jgi:2-oxo-4-hydroxy-4-carboxy-5-ureidoimidazoline decarboxylase